MRFLLLLVALTLGGCSTSSLVGTPVLPDDYRSLVVGHVPALDTVNAELQSGRFTLVTMDGQQVHGVRSVAIGLETTRYELPPRHASLRATRGGVINARYLPTEQIDYIATERKGGMQTGASIGVLPGIVVMVASTVVVASSNCSADPDSYCELGRDLIAYFGIGGGLLATALGGMLGAGVGHLVSPEGPTTFHYRGPVTRYLTAPLPDH